jgi:hypothetical protein
VATKRWRIIAPVVCLWKTDAQQSGPYSMLILETEYFSIFTPDLPHISRGDGGHLIINPKVTVADRTQLDRECAVELMKLTMVSGEAMKTVLTQRGVDIGRINYQDNGNWLIMVKSRSGSKLSLANRLGFTACGVVAISNV